jgi:hypothetical protein
MTSEDIAVRYRTILPHLDEKGRRFWCANEAIAMGRGGIARVARATHLSRTTIIEGMKELRGQKEVARDRIRRTGGGRKRTCVKDPTLAGALTTLVDASTRGDPESPLRYVSKSTRTISAELKKSGHAASHSLVARSLADLGYSLQANRKTAEGGDHPDRDAQFSFIAAKAGDLLRRNQPVISVDTKKKELIGNFKNNGREYHQKGEAPKVNVYDFIDKEKGKVSPYGVYDLAKDKGWVSVGVSHDTAQFAVASMRTWWNTVGAQAYPHATELYVNADGGGSNGSRNRLWKAELQAFADATGLIIHVSHFPPGTSKWNKIEHRMFCFISKNWRGRPLIDRATVVSLIGSTTTRTGLRIKAVLDETEYPTGIKVSDAELAALYIVKEDFCGEWNYSILPRKVQVVL